jgi:hypothetical protein
MAGSSLYKDCASIGKMEWKVVEIFIRDYNAL